MASPAGQFRPKRLIATFVIITAALYALVLFLPGSKSPKLGIDLQGGTRITLTAQNADGSTPNSSQMAQARTIMESRVNGSGVAGSQVQVQGNNQLVITVPGNSADLGELTRPARLNIRVQLTTGVDGAAVEKLAPSSSAASGSGSVSATESTTSTAVTMPAIGDTTPAGTTTPVETTGTGGAVVGPETSTSSGGVGLRAPGAATVVATPTAGTDEPSTGSTSAPTTGASAPVAATSGLATASNLLDTTAATAAPATWPLAGSDADNPNQPAGTDASAWTAWETAAKSAISAGTISCANIDKKAGQDDATKPLLACGQGEYTAADLAAGTNPCAPDATNACVFLLDKTLIAGDEIGSAAAVYSSGGSGNSTGWVINLQFKSSGYSTWASYTASHNASTDTDGTGGSFTAFTLDGEVLSSPQISGAITTTVTTVSGSFTQTSATSLANALKFGALPMNFGQGESQSVSAELGLEYLKAGLIAGGIGLALVVLYCLIYYRLLGVITILSLVLSFGLVYAIMVLLGRWIGLSLDMAGVAGLIVAIGITADSFVIYFERIKDEVREGRTFRSAVPRGWERAKRTILSADAVSFLSALVLYVIASGDVRGFAFTLGLSTVLDLVVVFLVTHPLVALAAGSKIFESPTLSGLGSVARAGAQQRSLAARLAAKEA